MKPAIHALWLFTALALSSAEAAWHERFGAGSVPAHHVRLTVVGKDNDLQRRQAEEAYRGCAELNGKLGRPVEPLPPGGIPPVIQSGEMEIYYADRRTATVDTGSLYAIDRRNCALTRTDHATLTIVTDQGLCKVDLRRRTLTGLCETGPAAGAGSPPKVRMSGDLSKVPPELRPQLHQALSRLEKRGRAPDGTYAPGLAGSGTYKQIAGLRCEIYRHSDMDKCVAHPQSAFLIPANPYHLHIPGLLLEIRSPATNAAAQSVRLGIQVSERVFQVPEALKAPGGQP